MTDINKHHSAPQNPTAPGVIRVSYPSYEPSASTQPQYMDLSKPQYFQSQCLFKLCFLDLFNLCFLAIL